MKMGLVERLRLSFGKLRAERYVIAVAGDEPESTATRPANSSFINVERGPEGGPFACPCCSLTLPMRGQYELCQVCFWEDDGQDEHDANVVRLGPNGDLSLTQARANYAAFGASHLAFLDTVRPPTPAERPSE